MALAAPHVGGVTAGTTSDAWTSVPGSLIVAVQHTYSNTSAAADGDVTDSKGNSYTLAIALLGGVSAVGVGIWYNNNGTRGATHTVTTNTPATDHNNAIIEITGQDLTSAVWDTTTDATGTDAVSPFDVVAAAAIAAVQIAIYGVTLDVGTNNAWTQPGGYTNIRNFGDGLSALVSCASYKINETGTPTVGATSAHTPSVGREVFATFKEAAGGIALTLPRSVPVIYLRKNR